MFVEICEFLFGAKPNVGGSGNVPPTLSLRSANLTANAAANVERTGKPESALSNPLRLVGQALKNAPKSCLKGDEL